jgi:hypothetical protein
MYADDVALIAESESDLRKMLKISHDFACKWNLNIFSPVPHFSTISKKDRHAKLYQMLLIDQGKLYKFLV